MYQLCRTLNALFVLVLGGVLIGGYMVQFLLHEQPCPLCMLQRLAMLGIACGPLLNLRFGMKPIHYGFSILCALFGDSVSLRHIALHICPGFPKFGEPIWGLSLYSWAFLVFACSLFAIAILLMMHTREIEEREHTGLNRLEKSAFALIVFLALANATTTFLSCGFGPCEG